MLKTRQEASFARDFLKQLRNLRVVYLWVFFSMISACFANSVHSKIYNFKPKVGADVNMHNAYANF